MWYDTDLARDLHERREYHSLRNETYDLRVGLKIQPPPKQIKFPLEVDWDRGGYKCAYGIGYEVEKDEDYFDEMEHPNYLPIFHRCENDGSCGVEFVTGILPLAPPSIIRDVVFNEFSAASEVFNMGSNGRCGGHTTVSINGWSGKKLAKRMRPYIGVVYALFRKRLKNSYCCADPFILKGRDDDDTRYKPVLVKSKSVEFRVVSRFINTNQAMQRYKLFYEVVDAAFHNRSHRVFMGRVKPIIADMYGGDDDKVQMILDHAKGFQKALNTNTITDTAREFFNPDEIHNLEAELRRAQEIADAQAAMEAANARRDALAMMFTEHAA